MHLLSNKICSTKHVDVTTYSYAILMHDNAKAEMANANRIGSA